ncbi:flavin reductase family protein [Actinomadura meridiana]|uniref:Flavin reductase family protein n=1 Tax=Actinomadura meridiana TaxID=559626 RepID=A0ABP8CFI1_9ACTN
MTSTTVADTGTAGLRHVFGHFATGVTVITTMASGEPAGFCCQTFVPVSLEPPLVSFCAARTSRTWPRIRASGAFCVNVLTADQTDVARRFAAPSDQGRFTSLDLSPSPTGSPMLSGALAWIDCSLYSHQVAGDHHIVLGRVRHVRAAPTGDPLLYFRGTFA